jgi:DNA polymerase III delta subunit
MKLITIEGDHTEKSYERLSKLISVAKKRGWKVKRYQKQENTLPEFLRARELFASESIYIVDDLNSIKPKELEWIKKNKDNLDITLIIYHSGFLSKRIKKLLPKPDKEEVYKLPKLIWKFLDSIYPGNTKQALTYFRKTIENEPVEFVFALISSHIQNLYWSRVSKNLPYPSWRKRKIISQANKFEKTRLKEFIDELAKIDIKVKTSSANLSDSLDFILATKLE